MRTFCSLVAIATLVAGVSADDVPMSSEEVVQAIRDGLKPLEESERAASGYKCYSKITARGRVRGRDITESSIFVSRVARSEDNLAIRSEKQGSNLGTKAVLNESSMFLIARKHPEAAWTLSKFSRTDREAAFLQIVGMRQIIIHPLTMDSVSSLIRETLDNSSFHVSSVKPRTDGMIDVKCSVELTNSKRTAIQSGIWTLSSKHHYALVGYDQKMTINGQEFRARCTRILSEPGQPIRCKSIQFTYVNMKTGVASQEQQFDFSGYSTDPIPEEQFTLAYYQIPEPTDADALPIPFYKGWKFWLAVSIVCFPLMLLLRWLARRQTREGVQT